MCVDNIYLRIYLLHHLPPPLDQDHHGYDDQAHQQQADGGGRGEERVEDHAVTAAQSLDTEQYEDLSLIKWVWICGL